MSVIRLPILVFIAQSALAPTCADLSSLHPPDTAITLAQTVEAGAFTSSAPPAQVPNVFQALPAFCRVAATLTPVSGFGHQDRILAAGGGLERELFQGCYFQRRGGHSRSQSVPRKLLRFLNDFGHL